MSKKKTILAYTALFALLLAVCFGLFFRKGLLPIYKIDGLGQYYPAFMYIGKITREFITGTVSGGHIRFYDLSVGMGEDIFGTLNYYGFGDPVNILSVFATDSTGPYLFSLIYFLRLYLGGFCFMIYCRRFLKPSPATVLAGISYVFWGYGIYAAGMYTMYAAMLYVLPLLLTGCEQILAKERSPLLFITAIYLGLCGFYFTYICSLFLVPYCIIRSIFIFGTKDLRSVIKGCLSCAASFILGIGCSLPILLPSLSAFLSSERNASSIAGTLFNFSYYIPSLDRSFVWDANIMNSLRNYPVLLSGIAVFFMPKSKRIIQLRIAVVTLLILLYLPITARVANGFADPRDRWVFEAQLVLCVVFAVVSDQLASDAGYKRFAPAVYAAVFINIILSFWTLYSGMGKDQKVLYASAEEVRGEMVSPVTDFEVASGDDSLYRISGDFTSAINERPKNNAMLNGYFGIDYWFSIVNENTQKYVDEVTGVQNGWRSFGFGDDINAETEAGVKYRFSKTGDVPEGYTFVSSVEEEGVSWSVYENNDFHSFARITDKSGNVLSYCDDCAYDTNTFTCSVTGEDTSGTGIVVTSIPYAKGWSASVNGKKIETFDSNRFLAVSSSGLLNGDIIKFEYESPGFHTGIKLALASLFLYILYYIFPMIPKKKTIQPQ